jgi:hypothetical protein
MLKFVNGAGVHLAFVREGKLRLQAAEACRPVPLSFSMAHCQQIALLAVSDCRLACPGTHPCGASARVHGLRDDNRQNQVTEGVPNAIAFKMWDRGAYGRRTMDSEPRNRNDTVWKGHQEW